MRQVLSVLLATFLYCTIAYLPNAITMEGCPEGPKHQGAKFVRVLSRDGIVITAGERSMMHILCQVVAVGDGH